jgi:hypothetical protein
MSLQTFKKKGVINYGSKRSGKPPGGIWISQGPFGSGNKANFRLTSPGTVGFSINGGTRNVGYIGKSSAFSKNGTPFYGQFPKGSGGCCGGYSTPQPLMNSPIVRGITQGQQFEYIKPSVLSTKGMLEKKYKWIHNGQYPNYWVQPQSANDNLCDNGSQWLYIQKKAAANDCVVDTNKPQTYVGHTIIGGPTGCSKTTAHYTSFNTISSNSGYTKALYQPQESSQHTLRIQRKCANPIGPLKPFPFASNGGSGNSKGVHYGPPPVWQIYYKTPPAWYWATTNTTTISK